MENCKIVDSARLVMVGAEANYDAGIDKLQLVL